MNILKVMVLIGPFALSDSDSSREWLSESGVIIIVTTQFTKRIIPKIKNVLK